MSDRRKLVKTQTPGIYRREAADGSLLSYAVIFRAGGKQRREYAATLEQARRIKREREADRDRGEWHERSRVTLVAYLTEWLEGYQGNGRRGFRENTRDEYRRLLDLYALRYFGERLRLSEVTPRHLSQYVSWLADEDKQGRRAAEDKRVRLATHRGVPVARVPMPKVEPLELADSTIRNAIAPVRSALATAMREGLIRHNPATGLALPVRDRITEDDDEDDVRALSRAQLAALLAMTPDRHRMLVLTIASTGLRISEAIGLQRKHLMLDGSKPHVRVRRGIVRGRVEPPKTKYGRRSVPLPPSLVHDLRRHLADVPEGADALVFASLAGTPLDPDNLRARMLKPLLEEVGMERGGWHVLRHTFASLQIAQGANLLQLRRMLGHHSAAFTLTVYAHLLHEDEPPALDLEQVLSTTPVTDAEDTPVVE